MKKTIKTLKEILEKEITWCNEHPTIVSADYSLGFTRGIRQAIMLIEKYDNSGKDED